MKNRLCENFDIKSGQCKLFDEKGCWDGFIFDRDGQCHHPFVLKPEKDTCDHYKASKQEKVVTDYAN